MKLSTIKPSTMKMSVRLLGLASVPLIFNASTLVSQAQTRSYPKIEASFALEIGTSDPFDPEKTDVQAQIVGPGRRTVRIPAFFDGAKTWRVRYTPLSPGTYRLGAITLNGAPSGATGMAPREWRVGGTPQAGFLRIDKKNPRRFAFDNGTRFYPLGHDVAWKNSSDPTVPAMFTRMGAAGENWSRVWMNHWDDKNLDWPSSYTSVKFGELNLDVARKWDGIIEAAEKSGIYFQPVFQHHGQVSTRTDPNWDMNPYNAARGGFLQTPQEFFTNAQAKTLTKRKLRYSVARWGYSPSIMAWELWNEVQFADTARDGQWDVISGWHDEMAAYLRAQDVNKHLVTTSSEIPVQVYRSMDYFQHHDYPQDIIATARNPQNLEAQAIAKPNFGAEAGMGDVQPYGMHALLWASIMSNQSGASQPWFWDVIARQDLYSVFTPVQKFLTMTQIARRDNFKKIEPPVASSTLADLILRPRRGNGASDQFEFVIGSEGAPANFSGLTAFFPGQNTPVPPRRGGGGGAAPAAPAAQGAAPAKMTPHALVFKVNYPQANQMTINAGRVSPGGARLKVSVDSQVVADQDLAPSPLAAPGAGAGAGAGAGGGANVNGPAIVVQIPAGAHSITLENTGQDGVTIRDFTFANTIKALTAYGLMDEQGAALWIYNRGQIFSPDATKTISGELSLTGLRAGNYRAMWFDTTSGQPIRTDALRISSDNATTVLQSPPILRDVALYIAR